MPDFRGYFGTVGWRLPAALRATCGARTLDSCTARSAAAPLAQRMHFFALTSRTMAETVACLKQGKVLLVVPGRAPKPLVSPYLDEATVRAQGPRPILGVTRGRVVNEVCYAISADPVTAVFAQVLGGAAEQRLFQGTDARISELDFSVADASLTCSVGGARGTSAIGALADDGKGVHTVTEGDVIDCMPRWAPGGRGEIVYASAGIGRTKSGAWVGLAPFALQRLRFVDQSVEVLQADARYNYFAPIPVTDTVLYALRGEYRPLRRLAMFKPIIGLFRAAPEADVARAGALARATTLVRISGEHTRVVAENVVTFDVDARENVIYATGSGLFRISAGRTERISSLEHVEHLVII